MYLDERPFGEVDVGDERLHRVSAAKHRLRAPYHVVCRVAAYAACAACAKLLASRFEVWTARLN